MEVLFRKGVDVEVRKIFLEPDGKMVALKKLSNGEGGACRLAAMSVSTGVGQPDFFRSLEGFLRTFLFL